MTYPAAKVFKLIAGSETALCRREIADRLGLKDSAVGHILERLRRQGKIIGRGNSWHHRYRVAPKAKAPIDGRGLHPSSIASLLRHQRQFKSKRPPPPLPAIVPGDWSQLVCSTRNILPVLRVDAGDD